jgi:hypothetical protein
MFLHFDNFLQASAVSIYGISNARSFTSGVFKVNMVEQLRRSFSFPGYSLNDAFVRVWSIRGFDLQR